MSSAPSDSVRRLAATIDQVRKEWWDADLRVNEWAPLGTAGGAFEKLARRERRPMRNVVDRYWMTLQSVLPHVSGRMQRELVDLGQQFNKAIEPREWWPGDKMDKCVTSLRLRLAARASQLDHRQEEPPAGDGQSEAASAAAAGDRFTPTREDLDILGALAKAPSTLTQIDVETGSGRPLAVVKKRLPILERAGLVNRPHGPRKGYGITTSGRALLNL